MSLSADTARTRWRRSSAVHQWRRLSGRWWLDGMEVDFAAVWSTWIDAHEDSEAAALGHLLLAMDRARLLDDTHRPA